MRKTIYEIFNNNLKRLIKNPANKKVLIAYSGGMDSTVLLDLFLKTKDIYNIKIFVCYINHNLRAKESIEEEKFVKNYLKNLNVDFFIRSVPLEYWNTKRAKSIEMAARDIRYSILQEITKENNIDYIATAHHFLDKIETFFLNLLRGTSLETLKSIPMKNKNIIRPLLNISKREIIDYADKNKLQYIIDSSNSKDIYKRNIVRNNLIPVLEKINKNYEKSFKNIFKFLKEENSILKKYIANIIKKITLFNSNSVFIIDYKSFKNKKNFIKKKIVKYILKKIHCYHLLTKSLFTIIKNKRIVYEKSNLYIGSKFKFLYFINTKDLKKIEKDIILKEIDNLTTSDFKIEVLEKENINYRKNLVINKDRLELPLIIRNLKDNDTIFIKNRDKNIKKLLKKKIGIPDILIPYTIIIQDSKNEIIAFIVNNIFRVSEKYFVNQNDKKLVIKINPIP